MALIWADALIRENTVKVIFSGNSLEGPLVIFTFTLFSRIYCSCNIKDVDGQS